MDSRFCQYKNSFTVVSVPKATRQHDRHRWIVPAYPVAIDNMYVEEKVSANATLRGSILDFPLMICLIPAWLEHMVSLILKILNLMPKDGYTIRMT